MSMTGAPATLAQLAEALPSLVPGRLDELVTVGLIDACGTDRYCLPSPSLLQLTVELLHAGYTPDKHSGCWARLMTRQLRLHGDTEEVTQHELS